MKNNNSAILRVIKSIGTMAMHDLTGADQDAAMEELQGLYTRIKELEIKWEWLRRLLKKRNESIAEMQSSLHK